MKFFLDNNLSPVLAESLDPIAKYLDHSVTHLRNEFDPSTPDVKWISKLGQQQDWIVVSADLRISRNKQERMAWRESGLTIFFLKKAWLQHGLCEQAWRLTKWLPILIKQAEIVSPGAGFEVPISGTKLEQIRVDT